MVYNHEKVVPLGYLDLGFRKQRQNFKQSKGLNGTAFHLHRELRLQGNIACSCSLHKRCSLSISPPYHEYKPTLNCFISVTVLALNKLL